MKIVVYGADGRFDHIWTPSVSADEFPAMGVFDYLDADLIAGYYSATDSLPARIALFRGDEIVRVESLPVGQEGDKGDHSGRYCFHLGLERWGRWFGVHKI